MSQENFEMLRAFTLLIPPGFQARRIHTTLRNEKNNMTNCLGKTVITDYYAYLVKRDVFSRKICFGKVIALVFLCKWESMGGCNGNHGASYGKAETLSS